MARATLDRRGKSLAVRIPVEVAEAIGLELGQTVEIIGRRGEIVIRPRPSNALETMFAGKSAEEWRELDAGTDVWGAGFGRENVEE